MFARNGIIIVLSLLLALIASIIPMPLDVDSYRPEWVLVVLVYWTIALPNRVNVMTAWLMGFLLDVLLGSTLGVHAAAMALSVYIATANYQKIRNFSVMQQALIVGVLTALYNLLVFWLQRFLTDIIFSPDYLNPVITSVVLWPWAFLLLRKIRRQFKVS